MKHLDCHASVEPRPRGHQHRALTTQPIGSVLWMFDLAHDWEIFGQHRGDGVERDLPLEQHDARLQEHRPTVNARS